VGGIMSTWRTLLCAVVLGLVALPVAGSAQDKGLPTIDLQARCKKSEAAVIDMMGDQSLKGTAFDLCVKSENAARDALVKAWGDIPPAYKSFCVRPRDYSASYVEWIACLEMMIEVKKLRTRAGTPAADESKRCPMITYGEDGSITRVIACPNTGR
jgi:hypothetical protein